ncbi:hypothetical protein [Roseobacter sp.]|uniref:tetratricopeptide repeat protein n=1 Tax=Roseobacter sp. TaxID=1907202 RepID=UPI0025DA6BC8|nr:hypothetical protein [Roseobacter sp.]
MTHRNRNIALALVAALGTSCLAGPVVAALTDFETSCSKEADDAFNEGLSLLHNMMYIQAEAEFMKAADADPSCAMAQWGVGMANFHPLWPGAPSEAETERGMAAAAKLAGLQTGTPVEQALAGAVAAFYAPGADSYRARLDAWAQAQIDAGEQNPDDTDTAAFAALARLATAPRGPEGVAVNAQVGDALDALHKSDPEHPGVIHYAIHAYDNPALKERGRLYAEIYDKTAPDAPHALHMPAHIFTRTGDWDRSIDLNSRSARAALEQSGDVIQSHYAHAVDYLVYGHLQLGEVSKAEALVEEMLAIDNHQVSFGGAYALAAAPVRVALETGDWTQAAGLSPDMHAAIPWDKFPQTVAMNRFARGLGAARSGDTDAARDAVAGLETLKAAMEERGQGYWAKLTGAQILSVQAWIELAEGNTEPALEMQRSAAELEDSIGKSPVTPGHMLPARELLGDMLAELGRQDEAVQAYKTTLTLSPNRARSMAALDASSGQ